MYVCVGLGGIGRSFEYCNRHATTAGHQVTLAARTWGYVGLYLRLRQVAKASPQAATKTQVMGCPPTWVMACCEEGKKQAISRPPTRKTHKMTNRLKMKRNMVGYLRL